MDPSTPLTVGILGCASIAKKNCRAAKKSNACQIKAIASRSKEKAQNFIDELFDDDGKTEHPLIFAGDGNANAYDQLLQGSDVESAYIPLPTKLHEPYVLQALDSSKHVLLEKPVATSAQSYQHMLDVASTNGKFLMDGTMLVHHPRTKAFVASVPNPNRVNFNFTFDGGKDFMRNNIRIKGDGDCLGCIGDLGWYCVRMGLLVFSGTDGAGALRVRGGLVEEVQVVRYQLNEEGVPIDADCMVKFSENRVLSIHCSFIHPFNQTVNIYGTGSEYTATMTDPILPRSNERNEISYSLVKQGLIQYDEITTEETKEVQFDNSLPQEVCMWRNFARWARKIEEESSSSGSPDVSNQTWWSGDSEEVKEANATASFSLYTQIVVDALMKSIELEGAKVKVNNDI